MSSKGPIIVIEDDEDDREFYASAFENLNIENEIIYFLEAEEAYSFLIDTPKQPFLIISDINLPGMSGLDFRKRIKENDYLRKKSIPFVFITTGNNKHSVEAAYDMMVQGYFVKPTSVSELYMMLEQIVSYWKLCKHPNSI
ncbi:MAG: response regulator [Chitinophagaceae bacterium]|nr:MAG: response regulator [Chitinophagaceae bacterium]